MLAYGLAIVKEIESGQASSHGYQSVMAYQVIVKLGTSSPIKAGWENLEEWKGPRSRQSRQSQALLPLLGVPQEDQTISL